MDDLLPPPPYSPQDPHTSASSPISQASHQLNMANLPIRTSLRGGYIRPVEELEEDLFSSAAAYFQDRPFDRPFPVANIALTQEITSETTRDNLVFPNTEAWRARDVNEQDWATFTNYVLAELHLEHAEKNRDGIQAISEDQFRERQAEIEMVFAEWNEGFFGPRNIRISPEFSFRAARRSPSPTPSYRTVPDHTGPCGHPVRFGNHMYYSPSMHTDFFPHSYQSGHPVGSVAPVHPIGPLPHMSPLPPLSPSPTIPPLNPCLSPLGPKLNPLNPHFTPMGPNFSPSASHWSPFAAHRSCQSYGLPSRPQPCQTPQRSQPSQPSVPSGNFPFEWVGGMTNQARVYADRMREEAARKQSHVFEIRDQARGYVQGLRDQAAEQHTRVRRASRELRGTSNDPLHQPPSTDRHQTSSFHRHRSSSVSSSSSSSSNSSVTSISSEDFEGADANDIRQSLAAFRLDPTKKKHLHIAVRQLRSDLRTHQQGSRKDMKQQSREMKAELDAQKRAIRSEVKALVKEARALKKAEKKQRKAEKRAKKAAKKAGKLRATTWGPEAGAEACKRGPQRRRLEAEAGQREREAEMRARHLEQEAEIRAWEAERQASQVVRDTELRVSEADRQASQAVRDTELRVREAERQAQQVAFAAVLRAKEAERAADTSQREAHARQMECDAKAEARARAMQMKMAADARESERLADLHARRKEMRARQQSLLVRQRECQQQGRGEKSNSPSSSE